MGIVDRIWHRLQATLHGVCGRTWFRLRQPQRARRHFERVLLLRGEDFATYVYLGRIAFACGDYAGWRRELRHAHQTNPERFARLDFGAMNLGGGGLRPRLAGTGVDARLLPFDGDDTAARASWAALLAPTDHGADDFGSDARSGDKPRADAPRSARTKEQLTGFSDPELDALLPDALLPESLLADFEAACERAREAEAAFRGDDFSSVDERRRFRGMEPIRRSEVRACDVDELLRKLTG
ncbi:MAG: hypothetical protein KDC48_05160 [Planctomycetes bacterium]|nr:hypothetical protein [Planctomycetota bacterium]